MGGVLVVGVGNSLLGDEGVGIHAVRLVQSFAPPREVTCLEAGTGTLDALEPMLAADEVMIIDAAVDGSRPGTIHRLDAADLLPSRHGLTAHDLGLLELLATCRMEQRTPKITVFSISIAYSPTLSNELSPAIEDAATKVVECIVGELRNRRPAGQRV